MVQGASLSCRFLFLFFLLHSVIVDAELCPPSSLDVDLVAAGGMRDGYRSHRLWALGCYRPREAGARSLSASYHACVGPNQAVVTARLILHFNLARRFHPSHTPAAVVPFLEYIEMRSGVDCDRNKEGLSPPLHPLPTAPYLCVVDLDGTGTALHPCSNCRARSALESSVRCVGPLLRSTRAPVEVFTSFRRGDDNERRKLHTPSAAACLSRNARMQVRTFVAAVTKRAKQKGSAVFARQELMQIANDLCLAIVDFESFLDVLRQVS